MSQGQHHVNPDLLPSDKAKQWSDWFQDGMRCRNEDEKAFCLEKYDRISRPMSHLWQTPPGTPIELQTAHQNMVNTVIKTQSSIACLYFYIDSARRRGGDMRSELATLRARPQVIDDAGSLIIGAYCRHHPVSGELTQTHENCKGLQAMGALGKIRCDIDRYQNSNGGLESQSSYHSKHINFRDPSVLQDHVEFVKRRNPTWPYHPVTIVQGTGQASNPSSTSQVQTHLSVPSAGFINPGSLNSNPVADCNPVSANAGSYAGSLTASGTAPVNASHQSSAFRLDPGNMTLQPGSSSAVGDQDGSQAQGVEDWEVEMAALFAASQEEDPLNSWTGGMEMGS